MEQVARLRDKLAFCPSFHAQPAAELGEKGFVTRPRHTEIYFRYMTAIIKAEPKGSVVSNPTLAAAFLDKVRWFKEVDYSRVLSLSEEYHGLSGGIIAGSGPKHGLNLFFGHALLNFVE